ncbi:hypothetical protein [Haloferax profundi]|uniref:Uncharacterized protein n=1 Tax=Haloferax profundi TaxID=1544718 RepID=A0A0W1SWW7_9EURY|nr:hypothetical protein [Haloferax profundi]KTG30960.1 hypothetical protein AUR66_05370 [Haloferax profundi]
MTRRGWTALVSVLVFGLLLGSTGAYTFGILTDTESSSAVFGVGVFDAPDAQSAAVSEDTQENATSSSEFVTVIDDANESAKPTQTPFTENSSSEETTDSNQTTSETPATLTGEPSGESTNSTSTPMETTTETPTSTQTSTPTETPTSTSTATASPTGE